VADLPSLITNVYGALANLGEKVEVEEPKPQPAVAIRNSIKPDYIVCLEDGKKLKMLKRYLRTNYNMTPEEYRARWGLAADYPMVAPNYAEKRRELAKKIGLGRKPGTVVRSRRAKKA
ncbi:MAG: transcriptional regulator, partial [Alphaproteobacteria bacterium HGW-Alphaproteobacteria-9]